MKRLLMTAAGAALLGLGTGTAVAEEGVNYTGSMNDHNVVGSVVLRDTWSDVDVSPAFNDDTNTIGGEFSIAHGLGGMWQGQVDGNFNSVQFDSGGDGAVDVMRIGLGAFYEGGTSRFGFGIGYDSINYGTRDDGWDVGAGGEFYISNQFTLNGGASYINIDGGVPGSLIDGDGWGLNGGGTYYARERLSLGLQLSYLDFEFDSGGGNADIFGIGGELEYLCPDSPLSFLAAVRYHDIEISTIDGDATSLEVGLKWRFNTQGTLADQDRSGTLDTGGAMSGLRHMVF
jgi:hypothetical protein